MRNFKGLMWLTIILLIFVILVFGSAMRAKKLKMNNPYSVDETQENIFDVNYTYTKQNIPKKTTPQVADPYFYEATSSENKVIVLSVLEDSRCPQGANCVWEGTLRVNAVIYIDGKAKEQEMTLNTPYTFLGKTITMISAGNKGAYDFKFKIQ